MTKTHTIETIEEYDENGKLVRKTAAETTEETNEPAPLYWGQWPSSSGTPISAGKPFIYNGGPCDSTTTTWQG